MRPPRSDRAAAGEADERIVRTAALALLAGRDFGRLELASRLRRRGYPPQHIEAVTDQLAAEGLLSEARFIEHFIRQHAARGHGPVRIRAELRQRGVDQASVEEALATSAQDWVGSAREVRRRKFGAMVPREARQRAKQARFLQYRGFSAEQARAALGPGDDPD